jgi:hypothetical protein
MASSSSGQQARADPQASVVDVEELGMRGGHVDLHLIDRRRCMAAWSTPICVVAAGPGARTPELPGKERGWHIALCLPAKV